MVEKRWAPARLFSYICSRIFLSNMGFFSFFKKDKKNEINEEQKKELNEGLQKSKENFFKKLAKTIVGKSKVDDEVLDNLEEVLVTSDVGIETTLKIIERIEKRVSKDKYLGTDQVNMILKEEIAGLLLENDLEKEKIILSRRS